MSFIISFKPVSIGSYSSSRAHTTALPPLPPHRLCFPLKNDRRRFLPLRIRGHSFDTVTPNGGDTKPPNGSLIGAMDSSQKGKDQYGSKPGWGPWDQIFNDALFLLSGPKSRKEFLLEYVRNVQPEFMELFVKRAPKQVVDAMRQTVTNMIGTLPPQFFAITVTTVAENLAQLMYSVIMTGYMFRNAEYRLELQQSLEQVALPEIQDEKDAPDYAPGTQKKVSGEVIRWNKISGPEKIDAVKYIELLEAEIEELSQQLGRKTSEGQNELLEYLKSLEPQNLKDLTSSAGEDVMLAMNTFIKRLLAVSDPAQMKVRSVETSAPELAKLLYWLMVVGYSIRNIEVRFDMDRVLGIPSKLAELPPGENI